jgi:hypothetical protein
LRCLLFDHPSKRKYDINITLKPKNTDGNVSRHLKDRTLGGMGGYRILVSSREAKHSSTASNYKKRILRPAFVMTKGLQRAMQ